jgi:hypothetical protein
MTTQLATADAGAVTADLMVSARHGRPATVASHDGTQ